jgi:hypothetical protein
MSIGQGELKLYSFVFCLVRVLYRLLLVYYTSVVVVLDFIYRETVLSSNPALESFNYSKDRSSVFNSERKPVELSAVFILDRQKIFVTVISLLEYKQVLSDTLERPK